MKVIVLLIMIVFSGSLVHGQHRIKKHKQASLEKNMVIINNPSKFINYDVSYLKNALPVYANSVKDSSLKGTLLIKYPTGLYDLKTFCITTAPDIVPANIIYVARTNSMGDQRYPGELKAIYIDKNGEEADTTNCYHAVPERESPVKYDTIELNGALFYFDKHDLTDSAKRVLERTMQSLQKRSTSFRSITVEGHTDSKGSYAYNQKLSEQRANAVKQYLLQKHGSLFLDKVTAVGYGKRRPKYNFGNYDKNRRVELIIQNY